MNWSWKGDSYDDTLRQQSDLVSQDLRHVFIAQLLRAASYLCEQITGDLPKMATRFPTKVSCHVQYLHISTPVAARPISYPYVWAIVRETSERLATADRCVDTPPCVQHEVQWTMLLLEWDECIDELKHLRKTLLEVILEHRLTHVQFDRIWDDVDVDSDLADHVSVCRSQLNEIS